MPELEAAGGGAGPTPRPRSVTFRPRYTKALSAVAAVGLVGGVGVVIAAGGSAADATAISASLNVHCTIPVAGPEAYSAKITATVPDSAKVGDSVSLQNFSISILLNVATTDALQTLGATTLQGSITAGATLTNANPSALSITATVPTTSVPQSIDANGDGPAFPITATGVSPTATLTSAGSAVLTATTVAAVFDPQDETGRSVLTAAKRNIPCTFDAGQSLVLTSIPVTGTSVTPTPGGPTPTPTTAAPTFTVSPNPAQFGQPITVSGTKCAAPPDVQAPTVTVNTLSGDEIIPNTAVPGSDGNWSVSFVPPAPSSIMGGDPNNDDISAVCYSGSTVLYNYGSVKLRIPNPFGTPTPIPTFTPTPTPRITPSPTPVNPPTPKPLTVVLSANPTSIPAGGSSVLTSTITGNGNGSLLYSVKGQDAAGDTVSCATNPCTIVFAKAGTYTLSSLAIIGVDDAAGGSAPITVTVLPSSPPPTATPKVSPTPTPKVTPTPTATPKVTPTPTPTPTLAPITPTPRPSLTVVLSANPSTITAGQSSVLSSSISGPSGPGGGNSYGVSGTDAAGDSVNCSTNPCTIVFAKPGVYTLRATAIVGFDVAGGTSAPITVTVLPAATPTPSPSVIPLNFAANGTLGVPTISGSGVVGPGVVKTLVNLAGRSFTGTAVLPNITINSKLFGFIPTTAVASFTQVGGLSGTILPGATDITADLKASIGVVSVKAAGVLPLTSGSCSTVDPVSIHLASNGKGQFSVFDGGTVSSTFAIGKLANCGLLTDLLNGIFPGPSNTLTLNLTAQS